MNGLLLAWLISIFGVASSTIVYLTNEQHELMEFAANIATINQIDKTKFLKLINCESRWNSRATGDYRIEEDRYLANGILQFHKPTFEKYIKIYDFNGFYENPHDQIILASWMIRDGLWQAWYNCGKISGYGKRM